MNYYTLNNLYNQGIIDYVPYDLYGMQMPVQTLAQVPIQTPYTQYNDSFELQNQQNNNCKPLSPFVKGLAALGVLVITAICLIKGHKKPPIEQSATKKTGFWSKLNPKNWFKKK